MSRWVTGLALLLCSIGCGNNATTCQTDSDCESHFCKADGTCGPAPTDGSTADVSADGPNGLCNPNHDEMIELAELPFAAGRMGTFRVATNATWDTAGTATGGGMWRWDLSAQLSGDADRMVMLASPSGTWWEASFPSATYATELVSTSNLSGVFAVSASSLTLLGVVSPEAGAFRTELAYDPPAQILALPITAGATWSSTSTVSGTAQGAVVAYTERYASRVDEVGRMKTPYGEFPVLRIATDLTRTSGFTTVLTKRTYTWVAECFGPVATAQSQDFESSVEFTDNAEVRRLAP